MRSKTDSRTLLSSALASVLAVTAISTSGSAQADEAPEKCYGVAKAGRNDCSTDKHACAGMASEDNAPDEWRYVPAGSCEKMGGKRSQEGDSVPTPSKPQGT